MAPLTVQLVNGYDGSLTVRELSEEEQWLDVEPPASAGSTFDWMPFDPQRHLDGRVRAPGTFDIQERAGITVAKTYYLDTELGNDANSGLTAALPKKTWNEIMGLGDYDRVIILTGSKLLRASSTLQPARNVEVIGQGTVRWTSERPVGTFTLTAGQTYTWQAAVTDGEYIAMVRDLSTLNVYGNPTRYVVKESVAQVEAAAGSIYWSGGTLYVHTLNGLTPTGQNLQYLDSSAVAWSKNLTRYFYNIKFEGNALQKNESSAGGAKCYYHTCTFFGGGTFHGLDEIVFQNCTGEAGQDFANYDVFNTIATKSIEIDCDFGEILGDTTNQPSTTHNACTIVRIGGEYHDASGQGCADVGASQVWMLGCDINHVTDGLYLGGAGAKAWLDTCVISDCSGSGINVESGATVYTHALTNSEGTTGSGTITPY
jgi:hypothetical protein